jgi:hypothetical protein
MSEVVARPKVEDISPKGALGAAALLALALCGCGWAQAKSVCATANEQRFDGRLDADIAFAIGDGFGATLTVERVALTRLAGAEALRVDSVRVLVAGHQVLEGTPTLISPTRLELAVPGVDVDHLAQDGKLRLQLHVTGSVPDSPMSADVEVCGSLTVRYSAL